MGDPVGRVLRQRLSAFRAQFLTMTRLREAGFFVQYDYAGSMPDHIPAYPRVEALFDAGRDRIGATLDRIAGYLPVFEDTVADASIDWASRMFSPFDAMLTYALVRDAAPARILEIGSGSSTLVLARALAASGSGGTLTCIDPEPRRDIGGQALELHRRVLGLDDVEMVESFGENDVLFIDSSHIMLPGMDVDVQFNRMFPCLSPGVLVHVHDIFLPDDYPPRWRQRWYSEQNALIGWLISGYFEVVFPGYYAITRMSGEVGEAVGGFAPFRRDGSSGSLWLRRTRVGT